MQNRAIAMLSIKAIDEKRRIFTGWATTPQVDRVGDILDPLGASFEREIPLLHQHDHMSPIGRVRLEKPSKEGIRFEAEIPVIDEPPALKERVDVAWGEIKHRLVPAVSVGFSPQKWSFLDTGGIEYEEFEIFELSTVSVPANSDALITSVKSLTGKTDIEILKALDAEARHAAGVPDPEIPSPPAPAAIGKMCRVVRLDAPPASRQPFVIREIRRA